MENFVYYFLIVVMVFLCLGILFGLIRTIKGPRVADRIVGINLIGSLSTATLALLAVLLKEAWLLDVCLIYCFISFLTVIIIERVSVDKMDTAKGSEKK